MEEIKKDFIMISFYIFEEITEYIELIKQSYYKSMKWENIKVLLRLAKINNRLTQK